MKALAVLSKLAGLVMFSAGVYHAAFMHRHDIGAYYIAMSIVFDREGENLWPKP